MICHSHKTIFVHIPRTAGTSIEHAFSLEASTYLDWKPAGRRKRGGYTPNHPALKKTRPPEDTLGLGADGKHAPSLELAAQVGEKKWTEYFKFTFVRNPWDLALSHWCAPFYHEINLRSGNSLEFFLTHELSADFLQHWHTNPKIPQGVTDRVFFGKTCSDWLNYGNMDFIGKYENREEDLKTISDSIGLDIDPHFRSEHGGKRFPAWSTRADLGITDHYSAYYNDATEALVRERYALDIENFGYEFERLPFFGYEFGNFPTP